MRIISKKQSNVKKIKEKKLQIEKKKEKYLEDTDFPEISHPRKRALLTAISECGTITHAAEVAGVNRRYHYSWMKDDPVYASAYELAVLKSAERLEQEARRRAIEGVQQDIFHGGKKVGTTTKHSDTLLIFLLKGAMPEKYSERYQASINTNTNINIEISADDRQQRILELLQKQKHKDEIQETAIDVDYTIADDEQEQD